MNTTRNIRKIGKNRGQDRLWLEGDILSTAGWEKGSRFDIRFERNQIILELNVNGKRKVAGTDERPIVDTNNGKIRKSIPTGDAVKVEAELERIIITALLAIGWPFIQEYALGCKQILIACELSGTVRDALLEHGHIAISCDLEDTESNAGPHIKGDATELVQMDIWDAMIAFPPCTYLCSAGLWRNLPKHDPSGQRAEKTEAALKFVMLILDAPTEQIALENPVGCIGTRIRKPDQSIQPYEHGHPESKRTCLWLKNLPPLEPSDELDIEEHGWQTEDGTWRWQNQTASGQNRLPPSENRAKQRSKTYPGIAKAMANQWFPL